MSIKNLHFSSSDNIHSSLLFYDAMMGDCRLCNQPVAGSYFKCPRCDTVYHELCWNNAPSNRCYLCHVRIEKMLAIDNTKSCCICWEDVTDDAIRCKHCNSIYHKECIDMTKTNKCPYCTNRMYVNWKNIINDIFDIVFAFIVTIFFQIAVKINDIFDIVFAFIVTIFFQIAVKINDIVSQVIKHIV